jgi:ABC-type transporter Mla subunit MlaD
MVEGLARILLQRLVRTERAAAVLRILYISGLFTLAVILRKPGAWGAIAGLQGLVVLAVFLGYSIYLLSATAGGSLPERLWHVSVILDAAGAAVFFYRFLDLPATPAAQGALVASEIYFFIPVAMSLVKIRPLNTLIATIASVVGSGISVVFFVLLHGQGSRLGHSFYLPGLLLLAGVSFWLVSRSHRTLLVENFVTDQFLRASRRLRMTMEIVQVSILSLNQLVDNLERISGGLAIGARAQAKSVEQITALAARMNTGMNAISEATGSSVTTIRKTLDISAHGQRIIKHLVGAIQAISEAAKKMENALELINKIADHTNLLALNASIEAVRAGEQSEGFSVVAGEIRSLAESSAGTAGEISHLVQQIAKVVLAGGDSSQEAARMFNQICRDLSGFEGFVNELKVAVAEQMGANREASGSLEKIREVTAENSMAADRVKQVVTELKNEVLKLRALLEDKLVEIPEQQAPAPGRLR